MEKEKISAGNKRRRTSTSSSGSRAKRKRKGGESEDRGRPFKAAKFAPKPLEATRKFTFVGSVEESLERIEAGAILDELKRSGSVPKFAIQITEGTDEEAGFSMYIQNIVVTARIVPEGDGEFDPDHHYLMETGKARESSLDLSYVTRSWRHLGVQSNPVRFGSVISRTKDYDAAALYFNTGRIVATGCSRPEFALDQLLEQKKKLEEILPWPFTVPAPDLENLVSSGVFPRPICVNYMAVAFNFKFRKVLGFSGAIIHIGDRAILVFSTGSLCHSGGRNPMDIYNDVKDIFPILIQCQATPELVKLDEKCKKILNEPNDVANMQRRHRTISNMIQRYKNKQTELLKKKAPLTEK